jgi:hypothetical protein
MSTFTARVLVAATPPAPAMAPSVVPATALTQSRSPSLGRMTQRGRNEFVRLSSGWHSMRPSRSRRTLRTSSRARGDLSIGLKTCTITAASSDGMQGSRTVGGTFPTIPVTCIPIHGSNHQEMVRLKPRSGGCPFHPRSPDTGRPSGLSSNGPVKPTVISQSTDHRSARHPGLKRMLMIGAIAGRARSGIA